MSAILEAEGLRKTYRGGDGAPIEVLSGIDLSVNRGEFVAIVGASGSGKSTLLHLLGALDRPTGGTVRLDGEDFTTLTAADLASVRNRKLGFVFQFHHLLREFSALENVMMPLLIAGEEEGTARSRAEELLAAVGLAGRMSHRPSALSGGEQQRVAVARAFVNRPLILLADEPTGNLDPDTSIEIMRLLDRINRTGTTVVMVTHDSNIVNQMRRRVVEIESGKIVRDQPRGVYG
jgi:cell division transport system ATP-binding protein